MKRVVQFVVLCIGALLALHACLPCPRCHAVKCMPSIQAAHYNNMHHTNNPFSSHPQVIPLARKKLREISGIAASLQYKGLLYLHEDNGHSNRLYLTNDKGANLGRLTISGTFNRDWEDLAIGPGPLPDHDYIYVADIGDNNAWHCTLQIYRFPEPVLNMQALPVRRTIKKADVISLRYPDRAHNAEAILFDPLTRDLYIATKEDDSCRVYVARFPQSTSEKIRLEPVITLPFSLVTSGSIASDGKEILLRNEQYCWYWKRAQHESIAATLKKPPQEIIPAIKEPQGEAICFIADQHGYITCSEVNKKQAPVIYLFTRKNEGLAKKN